MMMRSFLVAAFLSTVCATDTDFEFTGAVRKAGRYLDSFTLESSNEITMGGISMTMVTNVAMESTVEVRDLRSGGKSIDMTTTHLLFSTGGAGVDLKCDSQEADPDDVMCSSVLTMVDKTMHFQVDDQGTIAESPSEKEDAQLSNVSPSQQVSRMSRNLRFLPSHPVEVGSTWDIEIDDDLGMLTATATLLGFEDYGVHRCAKVKVEGTFELDMEALGDSMGVAAIFDNIEIKDTKAETIMYWDNNSSLTRYSETTESYVMSMDDPLGSGTLELPVSVRMIQSSEEEFE